MKQRNSMGLTVRGIRSQRGHVMVEISDYANTHYELMSELIMKFNGAMSRMADNQIVAVGERASYIKSRLGDLTFEQEDIVYNSCGWNGPVFVDGGKRLHSPKGAPAGNAVFAAPVSRFRARGSIDDWISLVATPLSGHLVAEFVFGLMFAGILGKFTGYTTNPGLALIGAPQDGKSMLLSIAASVGGPPTSNNMGEGYPLSFSGTSNGIEDEMQNYADMTMIWDEAALFGYGLSEK